VNMNENDKVFFDSQSYWCKRIGKLFDIEQGLRRFNPYFRSYRFGVQINFIDVWDGGELNPGKCRIFIGYDGEINIVNETMSQWEFNYLKSTIELLFDRIEFDKIEEFVYVNPNYVKSEIKRAEEKEEEKRQVSLLPLRDQLKIRLERLEANFTKMTSERAKETYRSKIKEVKNKLNMLEL